MSPKRIPDFDKIKQYIKEIPELERELEELIPKSYTEIGSGYRNDHWDEKSDVRRLRGMINWRKKEIEYLLKKNWSGFFTSYPGVN